MRRLGLWKLLLALLIFSPSTGFAQANSTQRIYFVYTNFVVDRSKIGQEILARLIARGQELEALDQKTTRELNEEEDKLTAMRDEMDIEEFTPLAEEFDQKTVAARQNMDRLTQDANLMRDQQRTRLLQLIRGEIERIAVERNGATIVDANNAYYVNPDDNLTNFLLERMDAIYEQNPAEIENFIFAPVSYSSLTPNGELDNNGETNSEEVPQ